MVENIVAHPDSAEENGVVEQRIYFPYFEQLVGDQALLDRLTLVI